MSRVPSFKAAWGGSGDPRAQWRQQYEAWHPRPSPAQLGYDSDWRALRAKVLALCPYCVMCEAEGVERRAAMVDHIVPISRAPEQRLDPTNTMPLCWPCHRRKTLRHDGGFGRQRVPGVKKGGGGSKTNRLAR
jgi:5-methylcytosine-specific restriction protein A